MPSKLKTIVFDARFEKKFGAYKKRLSQKELDNLKERFIIFKNNPFDNRLKTHKLKGRLKDYWAFSVSYSDRLTLSFFKQRQSIFH